MRLRFFRVQDATGCNAVGVLLGGRFFACIFFRTLYLQEVLGYSAMKAGLTLLDGGHLGLRRPAQALVTRVRPAVTALGMALAGAGSCGPHSCRSTATSGPAWSGASSFVGPDFPSSRSLSRRWVGSARARPVSPPVSSTPPAAWRGDRCRHRLHDRRHPGQHPTPPGPSRTSRGTDQRLPVGILGLPA